MKLCKNIKTLIGLVVLFIPSLCHAQWYNRLEVGYSAIAASAQYSGSTGYYDNNFNFIGDTAFKRTITATEGVGYDIGTYFPLKRVGRNTMWALSVHAVYNGYIWDGLDQTYINGNLGSLSGLSDLFGITLQVGTPIAIEFKLGPDAICAKRPHVGFSIGAGVMPSYNLTAFGGETYTNNNVTTDNFSVNPFVKAEVAFYAGLCFKLRAQYIFLNTPYIAQSTEPVGYVGPSSLTGTSELMLSFIIMPFSYRWQSEQWYNTYGRYNPYL